MEQFAEMAHAYDVSLENDITPVVDRAYYDGGGGIDIDTAGSAGTAGTFGGTFGTFGTLGCCC